MYANRIKSIREQIYASYTNLEDIASENRFSFLECTACKELYFPKLDYCATSFYKDVLTNRRLSVHDLNNYLHIKDHINIYNPFNVLSGTNIYAAFHYGSYRIINCVLHEHKVDYVIAVNRFLLQSEFHKQTMENLKNIGNKSGKDINVQFIDVESNAGIVQMIRALREGKSVVVYIDGGRGLGGFGGNNERLEKVDFLNKKITARGGVAFLSHHTQVPIVPVLSWRSLDYTKSYIEFFEKIIPVGERQQYITEVTQTLWDMFSAKLVLDPTQWEAMLYAHYFAIQEPAPNHKTMNEQVAYQFNDQYQFFSDSGQYYLYHKTSFLTVKLTQQLLKLLLTLKKDKISFAYSDYAYLVDKRTLNDLIGHEVLKASFPA